MEENQQPSESFTILNEDDQFKWVLPGYMAKYANSHFSQYVQGRALNDATLTENSIPSNTAEVEKLNELMSHLLKENNQRSVCTIDTTLEKFR